MQKENEEKLKERDKTKKTVVMMGQLSIWLSSKELIYNLNRRIKQMDVASNVRNASARSK